MATAVQIAIRREEALDRILRGLRGLAKGSDVSIGNVPTQGRNQEIVAVEQLEFFAERIESLTAHFEQAPIVEALSEDEDRETRAQDDIDTKTTKRTKGKS